MEGYQNFQEKLDIKILILFILRRLPDAVTRETLTDLALSEGNAGYFEYSECLAELVDSHRWSRKETSIRFPSAARETARSWRAVCR